MIDFTNISKTYKMGKMSVNALAGVSLSIKEGEFIAIMGPSGSGKSTLMHLIGFLDRPDSGKYLLSGSDVTRLGDDQLAILRNHTMGLIFQQFHLLPRITSLENVELPLIYAGKRDMKKVAQDKLTNVGLGHRVVSSFHIRRHGTMSGFCIPS